jgi:hypothetical protein
MITRYTVTIQLPIIGERVYRFTTLDTALDFYSANLHAGLTGRVAQEGR